VVLNPAGRVANVRFPLHACHFASAQAVLARGVSLTTGGGMASVEAGPCSYGIFRLG
jgi:hypothetical protein